MRRWNTDARSCLAHARAETWIAIANLRELRLALLDGDVEDAWHHAIIVKGARRRASVYRASAAACREEAARHHSYLERNLAP